MDTTRSNDRNNTAAELTARLTDAEATGVASVAFALLANNLAVVYHAQQRFLDADLLHKRCQAMLESLGGHQQFVAQSLANRAALYRTFAEYHEAERLFQLAMSLWDQHGWPLQSAMQCNLEDSPDAALTTEMLWAEVIEPNGLLRF